MYDAPIWIIATGAATDAYAPNTELPIILESVCLGRELVAEAAIPASTTGKHFANK